MCWLLATADAHEDPRRREPNDRELQEACSFSRNLLCNPPRLADSACVAELHRLQASCYCDREEPSGVFLAHLAKGI